MRKNKNCVEAETDTYKIQKLVYIADFQVAKTYHFRHRSSCSV